MPKLPIKTLTILLTLLLFWANFFGYISFEQMPQRFVAAYHQIAPAFLKFGNDTETVHLLKHSESCESGLPPSGSQISYVQKVDKDAREIRFNISNEHIFPVLLTVSEVGSLEPSHEILLHPRHTHALVLPTGNYSLLIQTGSVWCNLEEGFTDGVEVYPTQLLTIHNEAANLRLISLGELPAQVGFLFQPLSGYGEGNHKNIQGIGILRLERSGNHFEVAGSVNSVPAKFLIDTGATYTTISRDMAIKAGIYDCSQSRMLTANGLVDVCIGTVAELRIGQFTLQNVKVSYSKYLGNEFLLGMNVIEQFHLEQQGNVMQLSLR